MAGGVAQWTEYLSNRHEALGWRPSRHKTGHDVHMGNPSTKTVEAGRSKVQDPSELHSKSKASLRCVISERKGKREGGSMEGGREGYLHASLVK